MHEVTTSRRDAMRSLAILPALIAMPASAAPMLVCAPADQIAADARAWNAAMAHYHRAKADYATYDLSYVNPQIEARRAKFGDVHPVKGEARWPEYREWCAVSGFDAILDQCDKKAEAEGDAQVALLLMPAPDMSALRWKLEQAFDVDGEIVLWAEPIALTIRSDFLRLLPAEA